MILFGFKEMHAGGGAEKNLIEVALHVARTRKVGFYISGGHVDPRMREAGPVFVMPGKGRLWAAPLDLLHLAWVVVRHRVRLVHAHHRYPAFMANALRRVLGFRLITTVHNRFPNRAKASLWGDRAIAVSEDIAQWMRHECGTPQALIRVVHNGIADPRRCDAAELEALRRECGAPEGALVVCAVGRFSEQKNFAQLFDALAAVGRSDWVLLLVGEGEQEDMLKARAEALGIAPRIRFLGRRSDVPRIMQASDFLAMSSLWEGFPYVVVEALANRLPMVAADVGGVREGVVEGKTGWLVPKGDTRALTHALARAMDDREARERMGAAGRRLFEEQFLIDTMLAALDQEFAAQLAR